MIGPDGAAPNYAAIKVILYFREGTVLDKLCGWAPPSGADVTRHDLTLGNDNSASGNVVTPGLTMGTPSGANTLVIRSLGALRAKESGAV